MWYNHKDNMPDTVCEVRGISALFVKGVLGAMANDDRNSVGASKSMGIKIVVVMCVMVIGCFGAAVGQLVNIMFVQGEHYQKLAADQQLRDIVIQPARGTIYDRNMEILAQSATVHTVFISPADFKTDEQRKVVADGLSEILDVDREKIYNATKKKTFYEKIKRRIEGEEEKAVREFIEDKELNEKYDVARLVNLEDDTKRYYPKNNFAAQVLGFVGDENIGRAGIEYYYDKYLFGEPGRRMAMRNAKGAQMPFSYEKIIDPKNGNSLVLTIDETIQYNLEKNLEQIVRENNVTNRVACIAMNVKTGEILGMATKNDFDPNNYGSVFDGDARDRIDNAAEDQKDEIFIREQAEQWKNKCILDAYEPGSVFKIITGAAAFDEGVVTLDSGYTCSSSITVAGTTYGCANDKVHGTQSLADGFVNSCNCMFIHIGQQMGSDSFFKYYSAFGLTERTGIDLPGETKPTESLYYTAERMGPVELASESFGQTLKVTPIQLITAISAVANGGNLMEPHIVKQIIDEQGNIVKSVEPKIRRQVISKATSEAIMGCLEQAVERGSGQNAKVMGYKIAGKTGTSQKIDMRQEGEEELYISSFCGIAPADDPQIAILLMIDEPHAEVVYGGTLAAPAVGHMLESILPYLGVDPQYTEEERGQMDIVTPAVVGKSLNEAIDEIEDKNAGLDVKVVGDGEKVTGQMPKGNAIMPRNGTVVIYTDSESGDNKVSVPDLVGLSVSQANKLAANSGLNMSISGPDLQDGAVISYRQSVEPASEASEGEVIIVYFRSSDNADFSRGNARQ